MERIARHVTALVAAELGERHADIFRHYEEGTAIRELARSHYIPPEQVRQILKAVYAWMEHRFSRQRLRILLELPDPPVSREALDELYVKLSAWDNDGELEEDNGNNAPSETNERPAYKTELTTLPLTQRALNVLYTIDVTTVEELCNLSENQILMAHNSGPKTLRNIKDALAASGLSLSR